tara:strand:+ start:3687 stop:5645 length:1959 start_codon:yes stop_codon:yes gene_type:complete
MAKKKNNYNMSVVDLSHYNIPHIKEDDRKDWVEFGLDNLYPQYLIELFTGSGINGAIVKGVSSMVAGDQQDTCQGLDVVDKDKLEGDLREQYLKFSKLLKTGSRNTIKNLCFDLKLFGTCYINVIWNKTKTAIAEIKHIPAQYIRSGKADSYGKVNEFYYCYDWSNERKYKPHVIKAFNDKDRTETSQLLQIKEYNPQSFYYGIPDYVGGTDYIQLDMSIAELHLANIDNNFMPSCMVNFSNGIPTEEERREVERKLNARFSGSGNSGKLIITFNDGKDTTPEIIPLNTGDNDDKYQFLSTEVSRKVLTAHRITSPLLFGVKGDSSGFGNNADELRDSYSLFNNTVVKVFQSTILEALDRLFRINGIDSLDIYFKTLKPADFLDLDSIDAIDEQEAGIDIEDETIEQMESIIAKHKKKKFKSEELTDEQFDSVFQSLEGEVIDEKKWVVVDEKEEGDMEDIDLWVNRKIRKRKDFSDWVDSREGYNNIGDYSSYLDKSFYLIRFKYYKADYSPSASSRDFCDNMMVDAKNGVVYRLEDIDRASRDGVNSKFGHGKGGGAYDLFKWKGGPFCKHAWKMVLYRLESETISIDEIGDADIETIDAEYERVKTIPKSYIPSPWGWYKGTGGAKTPPNKMGKARGRYPGYEKRKDKI